MAQTVDPLFPSGIPKGFDMGSLLNQPQGPALDFDNEKIKRSKIKSLTTWQYEASYGKKPGEITKSDGVKMSSATFSDMGLPLEHISYNQNGSVFQTVNYVYDSSGYLMESSISSVEEMMNQRILFDYDEKRFLTAMTSYNRDGSVNVKMEYSYDSTGHVLENTMVTPTTGLMNFRVVYRYDMEGQMAGAVCYDNTEGTIVARSEFTYDQDGWETTSYTRDIQIVERTRNVYDSNGNIAEVIHYDSDNRVRFRVTNTYDEDGNLLETVNAIPSADMKARTTSTYDANGNVIETVTYNKFDEPVQVVRHAYEYYE